VAESARRAGVEVRVGVAAGAIADSGHKRPSCRNDRYRDAAEYERARFYGTQRVRARPSSPLKKAGFCSA
jgi:hypothetical protein